MFPKTCACSMQLGCLLIFLDIFDFSKMCIWPRRNRYFKGFHEKHAFIIFGRLPLKNRPKIPPKWEPGSSKNGAEKMLFLDVDFFTFLHRFWKGLDLQVGAQLDVLASHDHPKSLSNPIFWQRVSKMLAKRIQKGSQEAPDGDCWRIFIGFGGPGACPPTGFSTLPQVIPTSIPIPIPKKTVKNVISTFRHNYSERSLRPQRAG